MGTPRINPNDPRWTAYVLGELGEADREAVERLLESSAEARALVEELELATGAIEDALASDPALVLTPAQRAAVRREADAQPRSWLTVRRMQWGLVGAAATAAGLVIAVALQPVRLPVTGDAGPTSTQRSNAAPSAGLNGVTRVPSAKTIRNRSAGEAAPTTPTAPGAASVTADALQGAKENRGETRLEQQSAARMDFSARLESDAPEMSGTAAGRGGRGGALNDGVYRLPTLRPARSTESYAQVAEKGFVRVSQEPLATYSIDVDTASYSNVRRFLTQNRLPPADAVRVEELINYFTYDYPRPSGPHPIGTTMAVTAAPWNSRNRLVRIGIKAREIGANLRPSSNLVFLIDVSGSMNMPQKLPLVKSGLKMLVDQLGENDVVSIVVYAGASGLVLPPTHGDQKDAIARALDDLQPGGSTNGAAGIRLAYDQATAGFIRGGTNRVILMTDGDFNVGVTSQSDLTRLIEDKAKSGVFLSVLGFGIGNLKDATLEHLADTGNGNYAYIDSLNEARKVLVEQMSGTLVTVAKDVKIQVDFNPAKVEAYRLLGYENRALRPEDFNNDLKDAGDMGAGHTVTALFELVPRGETVPGASVDPSVFQPATPRTPAPTSNSNDLLVLRVRYKLPDGATSTRMDVPLPDRSVAFASTDPDFRFAAAVAAFGMLLRDSPYRGEATFPWVLDTATTSRGPDRGGYRAEFLTLVQKAIALQTEGNGAAGYRTFTIRK